MDKKILVIDDDEKLGSLLEEYLQGFGYSVIKATHPVDGLKKVEEQNPDLIILDVMMPDMDGFEVCRRIRSDHSTPVIMLTARGEVTDRIVGLELGADDYLPKPFEPRELVARIQSIFRRSGSKSVTNHYDYGGLSVDFASHQVTMDGNGIELTTAEFELLTLFIKSAGKVLDRDTILNELRGFDWESFNRSIDVLISRLRQKLGDDPKNPRFIKTMWGSGYKFIGEEV